MPKSFLVSALTTTILAGLTSTATAADIDWAAVGKALGKEGMEQAGGIYRIGLPRSYLKVTLDGVTLKPGFALGGWLAFEPMEEKALVMGDLVLLETEINPVMQRLEQSGIEITAVHNHLLRSEPATMYMHVMGQGDPVKLATELHDGIAVSKTPLQAPPASGSTSKSDLDSAAIDKIIGAEGKANGAVLQYSLPRDEEIVAHGMPIPPALGTAIAI